MSNMYRYPGAQPFNIAQQSIFFGRERDIEALYQLISLEQMVVLYAKSGLGKSSLINAGILPRVVAAKNLLPLTVRFGAYNPDNELLASPLDTALAQTHADAELLQRIRPAQEESLWYNLKSHQLQDATNKGFLLVFDQFEELFTYPQAEVNAFAQSVAEVLYTAIPDRYRQQLEEGLQRDNQFFSTQALQQLHQTMEVKLLIAIRSDRMSLLNRLKPFLASILLHTYELDALSVEQAEDAILNPAYQQNGFRSPQFDYEDEAVAGLIHFLSDGRQSNIESFQLQILCEYVEREIVMKGGRTLVTAADLQQPESILENYYLQKLEDFPPENRLAVRRLIEEGLIFEEEERRLTLYEGQIEKTYQIGTELLRQLLDTHLIRSEPSLRGGYTYELSHDTLVAPVLKVKAKRVEVERREREAELRQQQEAELAAERRKSQRARLIAAIGFLLAAVAIVASILAFQQSQRAKAAQLRSDSLAQVADAQRQKAQAVLDKIYFYEDRFGLAYDKNEYRYGFIDKDLNTKIEFQYNEALPFDNTGFAKVKRGGTDYLLDTLGREYRVAYEVVQLSPNIEALDLRNRKLKSIPTVVFQHKQLKVLLLSDNQFSNLPPEFGQLANLQSLYLADNQLSNLPPEFGQLANLQSLDLSSNKLSNLPSEIGQLTNLQSLDLSSNKLSNLPSEIGQLTNLQSLDLSSNKLSNLPPEIGQLTNLQSLDLSSNKLSNLPPEIGQLTNLQELYLSENQLITLPAEIGQLTNLQSLDLSWNRLSSLPPKIVQLTNLQSLGLNWNQLSSLPLEIVQLTNLQELYLIGNQLSILPPEIVQLTNLQELYLIGNQLSTLPAEIGQLVSLRYLSLKDNQLSSLTPKIGQLANLQSLSLRNNQLITLPSEIVQLSNLQRLDLRGTPIPFVEACTVLNKMNKDIHFIFIVELGRYLYTNNDSAILEVEFSCMSEIPSSIQQMKNLKVLDVSECELSPAHQAEVKGWLPGVEVRF